MTHSREEERFRPEERSFAASRNREGGVTKGWGGSIVLQVVKELRILLGKIKEP